MVCTTTQGHLFSFLTSRQYFLFSREAGLVSHKQIVESACASAVFPGPPPPQATSSICSWFLLLGLWHDPNPWVGPGEKALEDSHSTKGYPGLTLVSYTLGQVDLCDMSRYRRGR